MIVTGMRMTMILAMKKRGERLAVAIRLSQLGEERQG